MSQCIRPANQGDVPWCYALDLGAYDRPWEETELRHHLANMMVLERAGRVAAYSCVEVKNNQAQILRLVTSPKFRRQGLASQLLDFAIKDFASLSRMSTIVSERNVVGQLFLRHHFFRCVNVMPGALTSYGTPEDAYYFLRKI